MKNTINFGFKSP